MNIKIILKSILNLYLEGHSSSIHCIQILSDEMLVSGSADNTIKIWNFKNGDCIKTLEGK